MPRRFHPPDEPALRLFDPDAYADAEPNETTLAYLAGIVDADGTIACAAPTHNGTFSVRLVVHQAEREAVDLFAHTFGGQVTRRGAYTPAARRKTFMWYSTAENRVEVLTRLLPHLRQKRRQAQLALEMLHLNQSWRTHTRTRSRPVEVTEQLQALLGNLTAANAFGRAASNARPPQPPDVPDPDVPATVAAYLAGVLDADGHLRIRRKATGPYVRFMVEVKLKQVTPDSIQVLQQHFGIKVRVDRPSIPGGRNLLIWSCSARAAERLLTVTEPFMLIKKERAGLLLECLRLNRAVAAVYDPPAVVPGEPLITLAEAARQVGVGYSQAAASVRTGLVPVVRVDKVRRGESRVLVPESFVARWKEKDRRRRPEGNLERLEELAARCKQLNTRPSAEP